MKKIKRALVTGGCGFIGSHLVERLVKDGTSVVVLDDLSSGKKENISPFLQGVEFVRADIRDTEKVMETARDSEVIFHQAAEVSVPKTVEDPVGSSSVNIMGTINVLEAARRYKSVVVLASSCAVYGSSKFLPKSEEMSPGPESPYALQKLSGEKWAELYNRLFGVNAVCLRYFNVYGPRQDPGSPYSGVISVFLTRAIEGEAPVIYGDGGQSRDFIFVSDVVRANLMAAGYEGFAIFNVGTGKRISINRLWEEIKRVTGSESNPVFAPRREGDVRHSEADTALARRLLEFSAEIEFSEGLYMTFKWYLSQAG